MKNAIAYRILEGVPTTAAALSAILSAGAFRPCLPTERESIGWVKPAEHSAGLVHQVGQHYMLRMLIEKKILPAAVIAVAVQEEVNRIEQAVQRTVGRKEKRDIREATELSMLATAFSKFDHVDAYIDTKAKRCIVDTASFDTADLLVTLLKGDNDDIRLDRFRTAVKPGQAMRQWLLGDIPDRFTIDDECELVRPDGERPSVKFSRHNIAECGPEVRNHIAMGKMPIRLAVTYCDRASFVLTDKGHIKRFSLVDTHCLNPGEEETSAETFDANIAMFSWQMARVLDDLEQALGGPEKKEGEA